MYSRSRSEQAFKTLLLQVPSFDSVDGGRSSKSGTLSRPRRII